MDMAQFVEAIDSVRDRLGKANWGTITPQGMVICGLVPLCLGSLFGAPLVFELGSLLAALIGVAWFISRYNQQKAAEAATLLGLHACAPLAFIFVGTNLANAKRIGLYYGPVKDLRIQRNGICRIEVAPGEAVTTKVLVYDRLTMIFFVSCGDVERVYRNARNDHGKSLYWLNIAALPPPETAEEARARCPICGSVPCPCGEWWAQRSTDAAAADAGEPPVQQGTPQTRPPPPPRAGAILP